MKTRIEKLIKEYEDQLETCRREIKDLEIQLKNALNSAKTKVSPFGLLNSADEVYILKREKAVQKKKEMILVQARVDIESLLNYC